MSSESPPAKKAKARIVRTAVPSEPQPPAISLRVADGVLLVLFLALTFLLGAFPLKDTDFWWHLRTGDLIRQNGAVPRADNYTFTVQGAPWIDLHWVFQVAISFLYERGRAGVDAGEMRHHDARRVPARHVASKRLARVGGSHRLAASCSCWAGGCTCDRRR